MKLFTSLCVVFVLSQVPIPMRLVSTSSVLAQSDFTFLGYIRMPAAFGDGQGTDFAQGGMSGRVVGGHLHFFVYGSHTGGGSSEIVSGSSATSFTLGTGHGADFATGQQVSVLRAANQPAAGDPTIITNISGDVITVSPALGGTPANQDVLVRNSDRVYEIVDPEDSGCNTGSYSTTLHSAPRACNYASWGDVYHGRRVVWQAGTWFSWANCNPLSDCDWTAQGLHWSDTSNLLYSCSEESYVTPYGNCIASSLDTSSTCTTCASTSYGPFVIKTTDIDGSVLQRGQAAGYFTEGPSGEALVTGTFYQGQGWPAGPNLASATSCTNCTNGWISTTTPGDLSSGIQTFNTRWLHYYTMSSGDPSGNYWVTASNSTDGTLIGQFRSVPSAYKPPLFEIAPLGEGNPRNDGDPTKNPYWGFTELDRQSGCTWIPGTHKSGVICTISRVGSSSTSTSCTTNILTSGSHHWYVSGNANCNHGCNMFSDFGISVTGPGANATWTGFFIYNPTELTTVRDAGGVGDYGVVPADLVDITVSPYSAKIGTTSRNGNSLNVGYYDATRHYLFLNATQVDDDDVGLLRTLIYVFQVNDNAPPTPTLWSWLVSLAPNLTDGRTPKARPPSLMDGLHQMLRLNP
jgi:hypothetical protein